MDPEDQLTSNDKTQPLTGENPPVTSNQPSYVAKTKPDFDFKPLLHSWPQFSIDEAISEVGDSHRYQKGIIITAMICMFSCAFTSYTLGFTGADPITKCLDPISGSLLPCTEKEACLDLEKNSITFSYGAWTQKYHLYCDKARIRNWGKSLYFICNTLGCFCVLSLLDKVGRRVTAVACSIVVSLSLILACLVDSWFVRMILTGLANGCEGCFSNLFIVIISECSLPRSRLKAKVAGVGFGYFCLGAIFMVFVTLIVSTADGLTVVCAVVVTISVLPLPFWIMESPMWLYRAGRVNGLIRSLSGMARRNGRLERGEEYFKRVLEIPTSVDIKIKVNQVILTISKKSKHLTIFVAEDDVQRERKEPEKLNLALKDVRIQEPFDNQKPKIGPPEDHNQNEKQLKELQSDLEGLDCDSLIKFLFKSKQNLINITALFLHSAAGFVMYYGLTSAVQDLGLPSTQLNTILISLTQMIAYPFMTIKGPKMRRR